MNYLNTLQDQCLKKYFNFKTVFYEVSDSQYSLGKLTRAYLFKGLMQFLTLD